MKRFASILFVMLMIITALTGCGQHASNKKTSVVCTIFPQYDWVRQILGDKAGDMDITLILDNRIDLHNYQPSVDDIIKISSCDLFVYVGGESDKWVDDALKEAVNKDMVVINLLETLGNRAKTEEIIEGMEVGECVAEYADEDEPGYDEHVWLSLNNAQVFCAAIAGALSELDEDNAEDYQRNLTAYAQKLSALDSQYREAVNSAPVKTLLFGDRFPFLYLANDYGLSYYAAFAGCSAETEAGFETIVFLAEKADELHLNNIMITESSNRAIAETVKNNTAEKNQQILVIDAIQSVASNDIANGAAYLSIMESNLSVLKEALAADDGY